MSPSDLQEYFDEQGDVPLRLTLSSGDQIVLERPRESKIIGISLVFGVPAPVSERVRERLKIVSLPNIASVEPILRRNDGRRRRK